MTQEQKIDAYLNEMAAKDPIFAEKLKAEDKSRKDCMKYIEFRVGLVIKEYMKDNKGQCLIDIDDDEVHGWAAHYYDESNEAIGEEMKQPHGPKFQAMLNVDKLSEEQIAQIMANAEARIMKAEEDRIVNATLHPALKPGIRLMPKKEEKKPDNQLSLFD